MALVARSCLALFGARGVDVVCPGSVDTSVEEKAFSNHTTLAVGETCYTQLDVSGYAGFLES